MNDPLALAELIGAVLDAHSRLDHTGKFSDYAHRPVEFCEQVLGDDLWDKQKEILTELFCGHGRVVVPSCYSSGKSFTASRALIHGMLCYGPTIVVVTAPTERQVRNIVWGEVRKAWRPEFPGKLLPKAAEWKISAKHYAIGFATNTPERMQGYHEANVLFVMDEAAGVDAAIYEAMEGAMASGHARALLIGNPVESAGPFFAKYRSPAWKGIKISAFDTPNFMEGARPRSYLTQPAWVETVRSEWGEESPLFQAKVLGEFPDAGEAIVVPLSWFDQAVGKIAEFRAAEPVIAGLDVARFGTDASALVVRRGDQVVFMEQKFGLATTEVVGWVTAKAAELGVERIHVDAVGVGAGVADQLRELDRWFVHDVQAGAKSSDPERFANVRAEGWWGLRQRFQEHRVSFAYKNGHPMLERARAQVTAQRYGFRANGQLIIESKEDAKKRGVPSPDLADALWMAFHQPSGALAWLDAVGTRCEGCGAILNSQIMLCGTCSLPNPHFVPPGVQLAQ